MDLHPVYGSHQVAAFGYEPRNERMQIRFANGAVYEYERVPEAVVQAFIRAGSKGKFVNQEIKGKYRYSLIDSGGDYTDTEEREP